MDTMNDGRWLCAVCRHIVKPINIAEPVCAAYPDGVPWEIQIGQVRHTEPYPGDHGIQYEPIDGTEDTA